MLKLRWATTLNLVQAFLVAKVVVCGLRPL